MFTQEQSRNADGLIPQGRSDEDVERLTGLTLLDIIGIRGALAAMAMESHLEDIRHRRRWSLMR